MLISLVKQKQWEAVISRCKIASSAEYLEKDPAPASFQQTALHQALNSKPPLRVIEAFIAHPDYTKAMRIKDKYNNYLPIHCAIRYRASARVVSLLLASLSDDESESSESSILEEGDSLSLTPLHLACLFGSNVAIIACLVKENPSMCSLTTKNGATPLLLACGCHRTTTETIRLLLEAHPAAIDISCNAKWKPLHKAILHAASFETMRVLVQANPQGVYAMTCTSRQTPLALYWNSDGERTRETVSLLLNPMSYGGERNNDPGAIHQVLSFPQYIPGLLDFALEEFPEDAKIR